MKYCVLFNMVGILLFVWLLPNSVLAQSSIVINDLGIEDEWWYLDDACSFDDSEIESVRMIRDLFEQHIEDRIVRRLFEHDDFQQLVRVYTDEFVSRIDSTLMSCESWSYTFWQFWDYQEVVETLRNYVYTIARLDLVDGQYNTLDSAMLALDRLREHMTFWSNQWVSEELFLQQLIDMSMSFEVSWEDTVDLSLDISWENLENNDWTTTSSLLDVRGNVFVDNEYASLDVWTDMSVDARFIDWSFYVKIDDLSIDTWTIHFDSEYEKEQFEELMVFLKLIEGKFIMFWLWGSLWADAYPSSALEAFMIWFEEGLWSELMLWSIIEQDRLMTYATAWQRSYLWINPVACASLAPIESVSDCLDTRHSTLDASWGMWFVFLDNNRDEYSIWFSSTFVESSDTIMLSQFEYLDDTALVVRDQSQISSIDIPFSDNLGGLRFDNDTDSLSVRAKIPNYYSFDEQSYTDILLDWIVSSERVSLQGSIVDTSSDTKMAIQIEGNNKSSSTIVSFESRVLGDPEKIISASVSLDSTIDLVSSEVTTPPSSQIITRQELVDLQQ